MQEVKLTKDVLDKIKSSSGFDVSDQFIYTPKAFRFESSKSSWPIFTLKSKDGLEIAEIEDNAGYIERKGDTTIFRPRTGSIRVTTLENGITKIKKLPLDDGKRFLDYDAEKLEITIAGKITKVLDRKEIVRYLKVPLQIELQDAINERSTLTEEECRGLEL